MAVRKNSKLEETHVKIKRKVYQSGNSQVVALPPYMLDHIGFDPIHRQVNIWVGVGAIHISASHPPRTRKPGKKNSGNNTPRKG